MPRRGRSVLPALEYPCQPWGLRRTSGKRGMKLRPQTSGAGGRPFARILVARMENPDPIVRMQ